MSSNSLQWNSFPLAKRGSLLLLQSTSFFTLTKTILKVQMIFFRLWSLKLTWMVAFLKRKRPKNNLVNLYPLILVIVTWFFSLKFFDFKSLFKGVTISYCNLSGRFTFSLFVWRSPFSGRIFFSSTPFFFWFLLFLKLFLLIVCSCCKRTGCLRYMLVDQILNITLCSCMKSARNFGKMVISYAKFIAWLGILAWNL